MRNLDVGIKSSLMKCFQRRVKSFGFVARP